MNEKTIKHMPNIMTGMRLCLAPVFVFAWFHPGMAGPGRSFALAVFLTASATDIMDGYIARKYQAVSSFGKLADPLADKLLEFSALYCLFRSGLLPLWYPALAGAKELLLILGSLLLLRLGIVVQSKLLGKAACLVMSAGLALCIAGKGAGLFILYAAMLAHMAALAGYCWEAVPLLRKMRVKRLTG